jgi:hypothetical protein
LQQWRRTPDITNVDPGNVLKKGEINISGSYQYSTKEPFIGEWKDTTVVTNKLETITSYLVSRHYHSRNTGSFDIAYGIWEGISAGLSGDVSYGSIDITSKNLQKPIVDIGLYLRFLSGGNRYSIGFKPELLFSTVNGEVFVSLDSTRYAKGNVHLSYITERATVFGRYNIPNIISLFGGLQQKRIFFMRNDDEKLFENVIGSYIGISRQIGQFEPMVYIGIPLYADYTSTKSPLQIGIKTNIRIPSIAGD